MPSVLNDIEKARVRRHMGYPEVTAAASIQLGIPKPSQLYFLLEQAMELLMPLAVDRVRDLLNVLDNIEQQMIDAQCKLQVDSVGDISLAGTKDSKARLGTDRLEMEYIRWAKRLADVFGSFPLALLISKSAAPGR